MSKRYVVDTNTAIVKDYYPIYNEVGAQHWLPQPGSIFSCWQLSPTLAVVA
jgi:hypothetical protein